MKLAGIFQQVVKSNQKQLVEGLIQNERSKNKF